MIPEGQLEIIGKGNIGDKAKQLIEKHQAIYEAGFHTPKGFVLAEGFLDPLIDRVRSGSFRHQQLEVINSICQTFGDSPLVVRSSAAGDARGTGIYQTVFTPNQPLRVQQAILEVVGSYLTESAESFRKDAQTGEGLGVIIQPLVGQELREQTFGPIFSGFGYSSTSR